MGGARGCLAACLAALPSRGDLPVAGLPPCPSSYKERGVSLHGWGLGAWALLFLSWVSLLWWDWRWRVVTPTPNIETAWRKTCNTVFNTVGIHSRGAGRACRPGAWPPLSGNVVRVHDARVDRHRPGWRTGHGGRKLVFAPSTASSASTCAAAGSSTANAASTGTTRATELGEEAGCVGAAAAKRQPSKWR